MHWSSKYAWESGTVDMAKANWSSAIITEQIQADIPPSRLDGIADNDSSSWRVDLGQLYPVTTTAYLKFWNMLTSITRDGHFGRWKTACFDSLLKMDHLAKKKKVNSWLLKESRKCVFSKEGMRTGIAFCEGKGSKPDLQVAF